MEKTKQGLPPYRVTLVTTTAQAVEALETLRGSRATSADTETVARDDTGRLRDLDVDGPGPVRILSMAGVVGDYIEAFVFDLAPHTTVTPSVAARYSPPSTEVHIDRSALAGPLSQMDLFGWNADFDERVLDAAELRAHSWLDLMLAHASLILGEEGVQFYDSLAYAARRYLGIPVEGKGSVQLSYTHSDPLSAEQVHYAALDAVITTALADHIMTRVDEAQLRPVVEVEWAARPFRSRMERRGIYFDIDGWRSLLAGHLDEIDRIEVAIAAASGGGSGNLFDPLERPQWKISSNEEVKRVLNEHATDAVRRQLGGRLFEKPDSVDNAALQLMDHPLANLILEWRDHKKTISTYGEAFIAFIRADGRVHARYLQNVVSTGRMSSSKPNMQNNDPTMKHYYRPTPALTRDADGNLVADPLARVFVMGDLSQAELRFAAQVTGDIALIEAFHRGDDMHVVTASRMFHVDMVALKESDPKEYKTYRQRGKTMNFAVIYGLGPRALAETLTLAGVPTDPDEAKELLRLYLEAFPQVAEWLVGRDATIKALAANPPACDFALSLKLQNLFSAVKAATAALSDETSITPRAIALQINPLEEITARLTESLGRVPSESELEAEIDRRADMVAWAQDFHAPVIVTTDGQPFAFESRTVLGRRRTFNVLTKRWLDSIILSVMRAKNGGLAAIRRGFEEASGEKLTAANGALLSRDVVAKFFEKKELRTAFVAYILKSLGSDANSVFNRALSDRISALGNAYRNAPIQGGVADAVMKAFGLLDERLTVFDEAFPVQSVHDSIVIECYAKDATAVAEVLQTSMLEALHYFCPLVPAKADIEVATSLDASKDLVSLEEITQAYVA